MQKPRAEILSKQVYEDYISHLGKIFSYYEKLNGKE